MLVTLFFFLFRENYLILNYYSKSCFFAVFDRFAVHFNCFLIIFSHHKAFLLYRKSRKSVRFFRSGRYDKACGAS